jgi:hypothetical protein
MSKELPHGGKGSKKKSNSRDSPLRCLSLSRGYFYIIYKGYNTKEEKGRKGESFFE